MERERRLPTGGLEWGRPVFNVNLGLLPVPFERALDEAVADRAAELVAVAEGRAESEADLSGLSGPAMVGGLRGWRSLGRLTARVLSGRRVRVTVHDDGTERIEEPELARLGAAVFRRWSRRPRGRA